MRRAKNEKGMVLLLVLVVVALLTSLVTEFAFSTLVDMRLTETFRDSTRAWYLAKGGVQAGRMILQENARTNGWDHPDELWGIGVPSYPVGEEGVVSIRIEDLSAKLNINSLVLNRTNPNVPVYDQFIRLFRNLDLANAEELTDALVDWIDRDDTPRADGAESDFYQQLENPYSAKNDYFDSLDELALVRGFTPEVRRQVEPFLTVFGGEQINLNTASAEVLQAADGTNTIDQRLAEEIINLRETEPFERVEEIEKISALSGILRTPFRVNSAAFLITAEAAVNDGTRRAVAVVSSDGRKVHYLKVD